MPAPSAVEITLTEQERSVLEASDVAAQERAGVGVAHPDRAPGGRPVAFEVNHRFSNIKKPAC